MAKIAFGYFREAFGRRDGIGVNICLNGNIYIVTWKAYVNITDTYLAKIKNILDFFNFFQRSQAWMLTSVKFGVIIWIFLMFDV
jgi:hypothetical protein